MKKTILMGFCLLFSFSRCNNELDVTQKETALQRFSSVLKSTSFKFKDFVEDNKLPGETADDFRSRLSKSNGPVRTKATAEMEKIITPLAQESLILLSYFDIGLEDIESIEHEAAGIGGRRISDGRMPASTPMSALSSVAVAGIVAYGVEMKITTLDEGGLYDCLLRSIGIDAVIELVNGGLQKASKKVITKALRKVLGRALGYIGVAWAVYEFGDCMEWY